MGTAINDSCLWIFTRQQERNDEVVDKVRKIAEDKGFIWQCKIVETRVAKILVIFIIFLSEMYNNDTFSRLITANFFSFHNFPFHLHYFQFYSGAPQVLLMKRWSLLKHWSDHYPHWTIDNISS
jgi:hypothetical protein